VGSSSSWETACNLNMLLEIIYLLILAVLGLELRGLVL
jgi:hypothetical protein